MKTLRFGGGSGSALGEERERVASSLVLNFDGPTANRMSLTLSGIGIVKDTSQPGAPQLLQGFGRRRKD